MTRFTTSPLLIALMQTAATLPVFLVGLPAGVLADIMNRRHLLLATQGLIQVAAAALSVLTWTSFMNAPLLLGFTFVLGLGAILGNLAWQAINAELVPAAVTLSSVSYYLARAVGPIHGGPSTFSAPCRRCAACAIEMVPSVGSLRVILNMKSVISRHSWQSRGWIISGSLIA